MRKVFWILALIIIMSIALPVIILLIYRSYMTGLPLGFSMAGISNKSDDWSAFGSLVSGLFTWSGALSTLAALAFAFWQNERLSREAKLRSKQDEETANKNQEFMNFQKERMNFEKFHLHQIMFNELLDKIEADSNGNFKFTSRSVVYKKLFPNNNFLHCHTNVDLEIKNAGGLFELIEFSELIEKRLSEGTYSNDVQFLFLHILKLQELMRVRINRPREEGDIIFAGKYIILNAIDLFNSFVFYQNAVNAIISFCGFERNVNMANNSDAPKLILEIISFTSKIIHIKISNSSYPLEYVNSANLRRIAAAYNNINVPDNHPLHPFFNKLADFMLDSLSPTSIHYNVTNEGLKLILDSLLQKIIAVTAEANALDQSLGTIVDQHIRVVMDIRRSLD